MATYNTGFLDTGPRESELLKALMKMGYKQDRNPQSGQEAFARTASSLVDSLVDKQIYDDEKERAKTARTADLEALKAYSGGQAALPEQYIERGTADPLEKYLAPISLDPQVFGTDAPAIDNYSQNVMPQDPTAQDLMGGTHVMPDGTTMLNSDMTGAMPETPQNVIPQAPTADQLMGDPMGMALGGEPLPQELTPETYNKAEQAMQQQMVEGVGQGFDYNPAQGGVEGFSQEALQLALQNGEISPQMANNLVSMYSDNMVSQQKRNDAQNRTFEPKPVVRTRTNKAGVTEEYVSLEIPTMVNGELTMVPIGDSPALTPEQAAALQIKTARLQGGNETDEQRLRRRQEATDIREEGFITDAYGAIDEIPTLNRLTELNNLLSTGGITAIQAGMSDMFGTTDANIGEFRFLASQQILAALSNFTGAISDGERKFLIEQMAGLVQSGDVNKAIFEKLLRTANRVVERGQKILRRRADEGNEDAIIALQDFDKARSNEIAPPPKDLKLTPQEQDDLALSLGEITQDEYDQKRLGRN